MVFRDLLGSVDLGGWHMSGAYFFFPDWIVYFLTRALGFSPSISLLIYSLIINYAMLLWVGYRSKDFLGFHSLTFLCIFIAAFPSEWWNYQLPVHHGSVFVGGIWFAEWYLNSLKKDKFNGQSFLAILLAAVMAASDLLFGVWILIPLGLVSLSAFLKGKLSLKHLVSCTIFGAAIVLLTFLAQALFLDALGDVSYPHWRANLQNYAKFFISIKEFGLYMFGLKLTTLMVLVSGVHYFRKRSDLFSEFAIYSMAVSVAFVLVLNLWVANYNVRYLYPLFLFSAFAATIFLRRIKVPLRILLSIMILFLFVQRVTTHSEDRNIFKSYRHGDSQCIYREIRERGFAKQVGAASFWPFKMVKIFGGKDDLKLWQIEEGELTIYRWLVNSNWFPASPIAYYTVIEAQSLDSVTSNLKKRQVTVSGAVTCGRWALIFIPDGLPLD